MIITKPIKPKKFNSAAFTKALEDEAQAISKDILLDYEITTTGWNHQVNFEREVSIGPKSVDILVGTDDMIYGFLDKGTRKDYPIVPKKPGGVLAFQSGYSAKSVPNLITSRPGGAFGAVVFRKGVIHPGIKARNFEKTITKKWKPLMTKRMQAAITAANKESGFEL